MNFSTLSLGELHKQADATRREIEGMKLQNKDPKSNAPVIVAPGVSSSLLSISPHAAIATMPRTEQRATTIALVIYALRFLGDPFQHRLNPSNTCRGYEELSGSFCDLCTR